MTEWTKEQQAANRAKWVAALRSGQYPQGEGMLRDVDGYCCLGVACEVATIESVVSWRDGNDPLRSRGYVTADSDPFGANCTLPTPVMEWLGLSIDSGQLKEKVDYVNADGISDKANYLTVLNDEANWDFDQIADLIEADGVLLAGDEDA